MSKITFITLTLFLVATVGLAATASYAQGPDDTTPTTTPTLEPEATSTVEVETITPTPTGEDIATATPTPTDAPTATLTPIPGNSAILSFRDFGLESRLMRGPFDRVSYPFALPSDWALSTGTRVELNLTSYSSAPTTNATAVTENISGLLEIEFNGIYVDSFIINWNEETTITFELPPESLETTREDGRHSLRITLDSGHDCSEMITGVALGDDSLLRLHYDQIPPSTDLRLLPRPFYQRSFLPDTALVVVPTDPTATELEAAMRLMAGFGRSSGSNVSLTLLTTDTLTQTLLTNEHMIFVGKTSEFPMLNEATSPPNESSQAVDTDGILWMTVSPWNPSKVVMVVGGETDEAVYKAGIAASSQQIRTVGINNLAIISNVEADVEAPNLAGAVFNQTFAEAGFSTQTLDDVGHNSLDISFTIPPGQDVGTDAYFDLVFSHSTLLNYDRSGVVVTINDIPIGSIRLSDANAGLTTVRFTVPPTLLQAGLNRLSVQVELRPISECYDPDTVAAWFTIHDTSLLSLQLVEGAIPIESALAANLAYYPSPFSGNPHLDNVVLIVPPDAPDMWNSAAQLMFNLGDETDGSWFEVQTVFADDVPPELMEDYHLILVGRPSQLPLVAEWQELLPASFDPGSDIAVERDTAIYFEQSAETSMSYLELIQLPGNPGRLAMLIMGTDLMAVNNTTLLLSDDDLRSGLVGNLVFYDGIQVMSRNIISADIDIEDGASGTTSSPDDGDVTLTVEEGDASDDDPYSWIPRFIIASSLLMAGIIGFVIFTTVFRSLRPSIRRIAAQRLTLDLPFEVRFIDYRHHRNIRAALDNISATDPDAIIWAEGFPAGKSPGLTKHELRSAESLVILTSPSSNVEMEEGIRTVHPKRIYMVADWPMIKTLPEFIKALRRLSETVMDRDEGKVDITLMTERLAQPENVVRLGLEYLENLGIITVQSRDARFLYIKKGNNRPQDRESKIVMKHLENAWETVNNYRRDLRRVKLS